MVYINLKPTQPVYIFCDDKNDQHFYTKITIYIHVY